MYYYLVGSTPVALSRSIASTTRRVLFPHSVSAHYCCHHRRVLSPHITSPPSRSLADNRCRHHRRVLSPHITATNTVTFSHGQLLLLPPASLAFNFCCINPSFCGVPDPRSARVPPLDLPLLPPPSCSHDPSLPHHRSVLSRTSLTPTSPTGIRLLLLHHQ